MDIFFRSKCLTLCLVTHRRPTTHHRELPNKDNIYHASSKAEQNVHWYVPLKVVFFQRGNRTSCSTCWCNTVFPENIVSRDQTLEGTTPSGKLWKNWSCTVVNLYLLMIWNVMFSLHIICTCTMVSRTLTIKQVFTLGSWQVEHVRIHFLFRSKRLYNCTQNKVHCTTVHSVVQHVQSVLTAS